MAEPDKQAIRLAGGHEASICIIPTAAAPDHNDRHAGQNGVGWFKSLGATQVVSLPLIDRASANAPAIVDALRDACLIYLLGGFPGYLAQTLKGSESWGAMLQAYQAGAVIGGSSAGAMVLCERFYDPDAQLVQPALNLVPGVLVIPHHNTSGKRWVSRFSPPAPGSVLVGIDEQTGIIDDGPDHKWKVYGRGGVTLYAAGESRVFHPGESFSI